MFQKLTQQNKELICQAYLEGQTCTSLAKKDTENLYKLMYNNSPIWMNRKCEKVEGFLYGN